jgi:EAL domain-containing protein (putative c-di-GMP-specific phosphodiesterase class I)
MTQNSELPVKLAEVLKGFKVQPMVSSDTFNLKALELLAMDKPDFSDRQKMLCVDLAALRAAHLLSDYMGPTLRIHVNVELHSLFDYTWFMQMIGVVKPGIVIEIVERNELASTPRGLQKVRGVCEAIRGLGGMVAMDDVTGTETEKAMINLLNPSILKANTQRGFDFIKFHTEVPILVAERIENELLAFKASQLGAQELQGYWFDEMHEHLLPHEMTLPGVEARNVRLAFSGL